MTKKQKRVLEFIKSFLRENGYPPTRQEIGDNFGVTLNTAQEHLKALHRHEAIELRRYVNRGIKVLHQD